MSAWRPVTLLALVSFTLAMAGGGAEAVCPGGRIPLDISVGSTPLVQMTLGGHPGTVLLDTGATGSAVDAATHGLAPGVTIPYLDYSFPAAARGPFRTEDMRAYRAPGGGQKGRIGTDILAKRMIEFHHDATPPFLIVGSAACDPALLRAAGLVEVGVPGNYGGDPAARRRGLPNVPVIGLRIAGFPVPAQVDSGFADIAAPGIVQVNQPLMAALRARGVAMREARESRVLGCEGVRLDPRWRVEEVALEVVTTAGETVETLPPPLLEVKSDKACGGIATFAEPFAQIGASWLARWHVSVFDGPGDRVWIGR